MLSEEPWSVKFSIVTEFDLISMALSEEPPSTMAVVVEFPLKTTPFVTSKLL